MELTCLEKLVPSAEISPGTWLGLGKENEAGGHSSVLVLEVGDATGHWDRIKVS